MVQKNEGVQKGSAMDDKQAVCACLLQDLERNTSSICPCCPICKKSLGDYSRYWRALDAEVASSPVPPEYQGWQANILCNDCS